MPQFEIHFLASLVFWSVVSFAILLFLLYRYAFPAILRALEERENRIREDLQQAERFRLEAQALLTQYQEKLKGIYQEAHAILEEARHQARQLLEENRKRMDQEAHQMIEEAKAEIQRDQQRVLREVQQTIVDLAMAAAEKILERSLTEADHRRFVEQVIQEIASQKGRVSKG